MQKKFYRYFLFEYLKVNKQTLPLTEFSDSQLKTNCSSKSLPDQIEALLGAIFITTYDFTTVFKFANFLSEIFDMQLEGIVLDKSVFKKKNDTKVNIDYKLKSFIVSSVFPKKEYLTILVMI